MMDIIIGIYKITSPTNHIYIGQSWNVNKRLQSYKQKLYNKQPILQRSLLKYGADNHLFEIMISLPNNISQELLDDYERIFICHYKSSGYTMMNIREAGSRGKHTEESKIKISKTRLERKVKHTEETKQILSEQRKGIPLSERWSNPEAVSRHIEKMKLTKGKPHSKSHSEKISAALMGKKLTLEHRQKLKAGHAARKKRLELCQA